MTALLRNIFALEDESGPWKEELNQFPNHVPRFRTKAEAIAFTKKHCTTHSNPTYPQLQHSVTTLIDWQQIETILLPKIKEYEQRWPSSSSAPTHGAAALEDPADPLRNDVFAYARSRLNLPVHAEMSEVSRMNTLRYLFFHMKCGIYVMIRNGQVAIFCPFVNKDYQNAWKNELKVDSFNGSVEEYVHEKSAYYRNMQINFLDMAQWWANGNIICNDYGSPEDSSSNQFWGDHFLLQIKDMFAELCRMRQVPNCEFFINKRDYPQLKYNESRGCPVEPYGFIFDRNDRDPEQDMDLRRHLYSTYAPIMSFYSSQRFADIPIPPTEDWEAACGQVFPASFKYSGGSSSDDVQVAPPRDLFTHDNLRKFDCAWDKKINTAFFRGTATGGGVTPQTNQRLHIAQTSYDWSLMPALNGEATGGAPYLDAKITGWNLRDKKIAAQPMTYIHCRDYPFEGGKSNFVEIYKQSTYKYLVYVEGHCAACRYGFMMQLGSVILKVESSCVADSMWYFPLLRPFVDHVPVKADLSDLQERLEWCHAHDTECQAIARNAQQLYEKYVSRDGILDYLQAVCSEIHDRWVELPAWLRQVPSSVDPPAVPAKTKIHACADGVDEKGQPLLCLYCQDLIEHERRAKEEALSEKRGDAEQQKSKSASLRSRMKEMAAQSKKRRRDDAEGPP